MLLTGTPGVGKTTVLMKVVKKLRERGVSVGGMVSREVRERGRRVGFEMIDISTGDREVLASIYGDGARMGKYKVNLKGLAEFASRVILSAMENSDVIVCDEVGPMELLSPEFKRAVSKLLAVDKPMIIVIHMKMKDPLLKSLRQNPRAVLFTVTYENRDQLVDEVYSTINKFLEGRG